MSQELAQELEADDLGLEQLDEPAATDEEAFNLEEPAIPDENEEPSDDPAVAENIDEAPQDEEGGVALIPEASGEALAPPPEGGEEAAATAGPSTEEQNVESLEQQDGAVGEQIKEQPQPEKEQVDLTPSEFRLRRQTEDFSALDQPEVDLDVPSRVSEVTTESEASAQVAVPIEEQIIAKTAVALTKVDGESQRISGDFSALPGIKLISRTSIQSFHTEMETGSEESMVDAGKEVITEVLDREPYYELYNKYTAEMTACKIKNNFLQRKMAEYFRKRKMEHVLKETDQYVDTQQKYFKRLDALHELLQMDQVRRLVINAELDELKSDRNEKLDFIKKTMKQLLDREREISTGLIHTKTGKEIPEKVIDRLLRRQILATEQIAQLRLKYIKIRNRVTEKQVALQAVDKLGDNLRLVDYEQLKIEHRGYADKVEERDEELTKLRAKCDSIFQVLAHLREKSASATLDIIKEQQAVREVELDFLEARERTNYFKIERDRYRSMINKLIDETGILFRPKMLKDMENAIQEVETTEEVLRNMQVKQKTQLSQLRAIRKNMEAATNFRMLNTDNKAGVSRRSFLKTTKGVYKGRARGSRSFE